MSNSSPACWALIPSSLNQIRQGVVTSIFCGCILLIQGAIQARTTFDLYLYHTLFNIFFNSISTCSLPLATASNQISHNVVTLIVCGSDYALAASHYCRGAAEASSALSRPSHFLEESWTSCAHCWLTPSENATQRIRESYHIYI